ncbi:MFS transporter [Angustibacter sp. Root456]|uniref:MFS transporter n=1 Tax=Angustibacter sp. Root456 TaxID=1736539 RepID=UPI0009E95B41|nr:MFS transporter [Angustibacter sp. Root456]
MPWGSTGRLMHNRDYVVLLSSQTVSSLGSAMSAFVFTLLAVDVTGSPAQAGLVGSAYALGAALTSLPAGALVDRWNRKTILVCCAAGGAVLYGSVAAALALDHLTLAHLVVVGLGSGLSRAFFLPAQNAALRAIVAPHDMGAAMSANEGREHFASLVGAPLAGALYSVSRVVPVLADAVSYVVLTVATLTLRASLAAPSGSAKPPVLASIREGVRWVLAQPAIRAIAFSATVLNFCANAIMLVLIVHLQRIGTRAPVIGLLETGIGVGGLLGALAAAPLIARLTTGRIAVLAVWVITVCFALTALTTAPAALVVLLAGAIFFVPSFNAGLFGYQVLVTPDDMQGRAQSAIGFLATATSPLAPIAGGLLLQNSGLRAAVLVLCVPLVLAGLNITLSAAIRAIPLLSQVTAHQAQDRVPG